MLLDAAQPRLGLFLGTTFGRRPQVHRIGRTGRSGKTGIATTFINKNQSEFILLDLKHLLKEAKQRIPPVLLALHDPMDAMEALEAASGKRVRRRLLLHCGARTADGMSCSV